MITIRERSGSCLIKTTVSLKGEKQKLVSYSQPSQGCHLNRCHFGALDDTADTVDSLQTVHMDVHVDRNLLNDVTSVISCTFDLHFSTAAVTAVRQAKVFLFLSTGG